MTIEDQLRQMIEQAIEPLVNEIKELRAKIEVKEYPPVLRVKDMAKIMQIGITRAYEIARDPSFPAIRDGDKILIVTDRFFDWLHEKTKQAS